MCGRCDFDSMMHDVQVSDFQDYAWRLSLVFACSSIVYLVARLYY